MDTKQNSIDSDAFHSAAVDYRSAGTGESLQAYTALVALADAFMSTERAKARAEALEEAIAAVPGGSICDPQQVADAIRALIGSPTPPVGGGSHE